MSKKIHFVHNIDVNVHVQALRCGIQLEKEVNTLRNMCLYIYTIIYTGQDKKKKKQQHPHA